jgi:hypothetical protein
MISPPPRGVLPLTSPRKSQARVGVAASLKSTAMRAKKRAGAAGTRGRRRTRRRRRCWHSITRRSTAVLSSKRGKISRRALQSNLLAPKYPQPKMKLTSSS